MMEDEQRIYYYHGKSPRFTIAGVFDREGKKYPFAELVLAISLCSEKDQFIKKLGRIKASSRLNSIAKGKKVVNVECKKENEGRGFCDYVAMSVKTLTKKDLIRAFGL